MNIYDLNELYDMLKKNGYINEKDDNASCIPEIDPSGGADSNCCANVNLDIPGGFQDINPVVFIMIGEVLGNIIAGNVPFNMAVAISNWLNLVGQAIETYGAQQQYFQNGPGRYYHPAYKNVGNPFCNCQSASSAEENLESTVEGNNISNYQENSDKKAPDNELTESITSNTIVKEEMLAERELEETLKELQGAINTCNKKIDELERKFREINKKHY